MIAIDALREPTTAADHHDRAWTSSVLNDVACIHANEREGCSGCQHDDAIRAAALDEARAAVTTLYDKVVEEHGRYPWRHEALAAIDALREPKPSTREV